jgi:hypothetical protein
VQTTRAYHYRSRHRHRRRHRHWRVVILAISPLTHLNDNSALALRDVTERLHAGGRQLIVSGITRAQYKTLVHNGLLDALEPENLCPDLEFAIARGIDLLRHQAVASAA